MSDPATHRFTCPDCGEQIEVNGPMKAVLLESGCVVCGAAVSGWSFSDV